MHSATVPEHQSEDFGEEEDDDDDIYETMDDSPMMVQPGLYIGSFMAEQNKPSLQKAGVTHILQVAEGMQPSHPDDFQYQMIHVQDVPSEDLVAHFSKAFDFIDQAQSKQGAVLVHCVAGVSRSASVVIGYMMWKHGISYDEAFRRLHEVRPWVMPNEGFQQQLKELERLKCDLGAWRAWRHTWKEDPITVHLAGAKAANQ